MIDTRYTGQDRVVSYLRHGKMIMAAAGASKPDVFTGEPITAENGILSDDTYAWGSELAYYVDKYNVRLPREFEEHIGIN